MYFLPFNSSIKTLTSHPWMLPIRCSLKTIYDPHSFKPGTYDVSIGTLRALPDWTLGSALQLHRTVGLGLSERQSGTIISPAWQLQDSPPAVYPMPKSNLGGNFDHRHQRVSSLSFLWWLTHLYTWITCFCRSLNLTVLGTQLILTQFWHWLLCVGQAARLIYLVINPKPHRSWT